VSDWDFNLGLHAYKAGNILLEQHFHFALVILEIRSCKLFAGAGLKPQLSITVMSHQSPARIFGFF
jgi:hypothetical protein